MPSETSRNAASTAERSRKNAELIRHRLGESKGAVVAELTMTSEATVSRWTQNVEQTAAMLAALGLRVVDEHARCLPEQEVAALLHLARQRMAQIQSLDDLSFE